MEAKDTVMKTVDELRPFHFTDSYTVGDGLRMKDDVWDIPKLLQSQAEISFKAGRDEEWARIFNRLDEMNDAGYFDFDTEKEIDKLKG